ncbi:nitrous oxide reductase family maturation protein NosD [Cohnella sp. WQ 127256]|uniref:right-handed parallel beta-helix repeat-containing protein n=1 Tax=Cohnella sp. WQ 127256 TaxID=2938790 RepID=UPI0021192F3C|nr:NosD domain-containing protein [Cohnella sp. WQ 127256]
MIRHSIARFLCCGLLLLTYSTIVIQDSISAANRNAGAEHLQQIIDAAKSGDVIKLPAGEYEGPAIINKPLTIIGGAAVSVRNESNQPAIEIRSEQVELSQFSIQHSPSGESSAILVTADGAVIEQMTIETRGFGILVRDADRGLFKENTITWFKTKKDKKTSMAKKQNGIDLYNSHDNRIEANEIYDMRDGIYLENSDRVNVEGNKLYRSRYGFHSMYTKGTTLVGNVGEFNVTGAMVMGVKDALVSGNSFRKQSENVNSQGILLFDVQTSVIKSNIVEGNRVGIYVEQSSNNQLRDNSILRNFMGIQFLESEGNELNNNRFISNVIEAEALDSSGNRMDGNYWDAFQGLDVDKNGTSDMAYTINPFYQQLISKTSAYQIFFQSPGMTFLSSMFSDDQESWAKDHSPLMSQASSIDDNANLSTGSSVWIGLVGALLLFVSIFIILFLGVRKQ